MNSIIKDPSILLEPPSATVRLIKSDVGKTGTHINAAGEVKPDIYKNIGATPHNTVPSNPPAAPIAVATPVSSAPPPQQHTHTQPSQAQLVEVTPGVFDILFTCSCGTKSVIRCQTLTPPPPA